MILKTNATIARDIIWVIGLFIYLINFLICLHSIFNFNGDSRSIHITKQTATKRRRELNDISSENLREK